MASSMTWEGEVFICENVLMYFVYAMDRIATVAAFIACYCRAYTTCMIASSAQLSRLVDKPSICDSGVGVDRSTGSSWLRGSMLTQPK